MKTYAMLWNQTTLLKTSTYLTACRSLVVNNFPLIRRPILAYQPIERRCPECLSSVLLEMACKIDLLQNKWSLFCYLILIYHKRLKILPQFESGDLISIFPFLVLAFFYYQSMRKRLPVLHKEQALSSLFIFTYRPVFYLNYFL